MRTSTSLPLILVPFIILQAFSALSGESNLTVPQPFDFPFSILISANITWPASNKNEQWIISEPKKFLKCFDKSQTYYFGIHVQCQREDLSGLYIKQQRYSHRVIHRKQKTYHSDWTSLSAFATWDHRTAATQISNSVNTFANMNLSDAWWNPYKMQIKRWVHQ